ncbi:MAG: hypothetical protein J3Q66DRAFT_369314 [Benniella sp.]|nr:MAG: hypothetical protein J3Q66DRAFT_369314 [Benniella sp.]
MQWDRAGTVTPASEILMSVIHVAMKTSSSGTWSKEGLGITDVVALVLSKAGEFAVFADLVPELLEIQAKPLHHLLVQDPCLCGCGIFLCERGLSPAMDGRRTTESYIIIGLFCQRDDGVAVCNVFDARKDSLDILSKNDILLVKLGADDVHVVKPSSEEGG